jgi:hypothetical protein
MNHRIKRFMPALAIDIKLLNTDAFRSVTLKCWRSLGRFG